MQKRPPWAEEAERMLASGIGYEEVAKHFGKPKSSVIQSAGPKWKAYLLRWAGQHALFGAGLIPRVDRGDKSMYPTVEQCEEYIRKNPEIVEQLMSERVFGEVKILYNNTMRNGLQIRCSKRLAPSCKVSEDFINKSGSSTSPTHAAQVFRAKGWIVAAGPRADICPACYAHMMNDRRDREATRRADAKVLPASSPLPVAVEKKPYVKESQVTLKDIDRTAKRLIDDRLDEVYDASKGGYQNGYNDAKLAGELGTMVEWVALVRDFGHGPEVSAVDRSADVDAIKKIASEVQELGKKVDAGIERLSQYDSELNSRMEEYERAKKEFDTHLIAFHRKYGG